MVGRSTIKMYAVYGAGDIEKQPQSFGVAL